MSQTLPFKCHKLTNESCHKRISNSRCMCVSCVENTTRIMSRTLSFKCHELTNESCHMRISNSRSICVFCVENTTRIMSRTLSFTCHELTNESCHMRIFNSRSMRASCVENIYVCLLCWKHDNDNVMPRTPSSKLKSRTTSSTVKHLQDNSK